MEKIVALPSLQNRRFVQPWKFLVGVTFRGLKVTWQAAQNLQHTNCFIGEKYKLYTICQTQEKKSDPIWRTFLVIFLCKKMLVFWQNKGNIVSICPKKDLKGHKSRNSCKNKILFAKISPHKAIPPNCWHFPNNYWQHWLDKKYFGQNWIFLAIFVHSCLFWLIFRQF